MNKLKKFYTKHYYAISFFSFILVYNIVFTCILGEWEFHNEALSFHLVDFSMGFCSRFLVGAIYNSIFDNTSVLSVILYESILLITFLLIISFYLEKLVLSIEKEHRKTILFILIFFVTGTSTLPMYVYMLGSFDSYWFYLSIIFIALLSRKQLYIFIVPVFITTIIIHYASIVAFIPFYLFILLYKISITEEKKERFLLWAIVVVSTVSAILFAGYFIVFDNKNLTYSMEDFIAILKSRGIVSEPIYYLTSFYDYDYFGMLDKESFANITSPFLYALKFLEYRIKVNFELIPFEQGFVPFLLNLPVVVFILLYLRDRNKENSTNKIRIITTFCMCAMFFCTIILSVFLSTDIVRFISHAYMLLFASFLYIIYNEKGAYLEYIDAYIMKFPKSIIALYIIFYTTMIFKPYT
ncbi:MAG: hypothetical protein IJO73_02290 [Clostridia bacterium]|nr:hypothetical protein [Clostridia bacterium]